MFDWVAFSKYAGVFTALIATGFGFPMPEEIPIVTAGAMVGHDAQEKLHNNLAGAIGGGPAYHLTPVPPSGTKWYIMLPVCILGVVLGDSVLYAAGRLFGTHLLHSPWVQRNVIPPTTRASIEENFRTRGVMILLAARFTPGIRTPVFIMAGVVRLPFSRFLFADALYAIPGVNLMFWLAYWFTDQFVEAIEAAERHRPMVVVAILSAALGIILYRFLTSRTLSTGDPAKIPTLAKPVGAVTFAVEQVVEMAVEKTVEKTKDAFEKVTHPHGRTDKSHGDRPTPPPAPVPAPPPDSVDG